MTWYFDLENQSWEKVWSYKKHEHYPKVLYVSCSFPTLTTQGYTYVSWSIQTPQQTHTHTHIDLYISSPSCPMNTNISEQRLIA